MTSKTWLSASIVIGLTVGFGARVLTGEGMATAPSTGDGPAIEQASGRPWMHPEIAVVVKVPAKRPKEFVLASSAGAEGPLSEEVRIAETTERPWMHPEIAVVVQVPAKPNTGAVLVSSAGEGEAIEASSTPWMHPEIAVVVQVPAKNERILAMNEPTSDVTRRAPSLWRDEDGNPGVADRHPRHPRRLDDRGFGPRIRERNADPSRIDTGRGQGTSRGTPFTPGSGFPRTGAVSGTSLDA